MEKKLSRQRLWQIRNKERGLCVQCGAEAEHGKSRCVKCNDKEKTKYADKRMSGICARCGKPANGHSLCDDCKKKVAEYNKKRGTDEIAKANRAERDRLGLCTKCGAERDTEKKMCAKCREYFRNNYARRSEKQ